MNFEEKKENDRTEEILGLIIQGEATVFRAELPVDFEEKLLVPPPENKLMSNDLTALAPTARPR